MNSKVSIARPKICVVLRWASPWASNAQPRGREIVFVVGAPDLGTRFDLVKVGKSGAVKVLVNYPLRFAIVFWMLRVMLGMSRFSALAFDHWLKDVFSLSRSLSFSLSLSLYVYIHICIYSI